VLNSSKKIVNFWPNTIYVWKKLLLINPHCIGDSGVSISTLVQVTFSEKGTKINPHTCPHPTIWNPCCSLHFPHIFSNIAKYFCFLPLWYDYLKRISQSFCNVALPKKPDSAVFFQKSIQSWQKAKQIGDIWKKCRKMLKTGYFHHCLPMHWK